MGDFPWKVPWAAAKSESSAAGAVTLKGGRWGSAGVRRKGAMPQDHREEEGDRILLEEHQIPVSTEEKPRAGKGTVVLTERRLIVA